MGSNFWGDNLGIPPVPPVPPPPALGEPCRCYKVKEKFNYDMKERVHLAYQKATSRGFWLVIFLFVLVKNQQHIILLSHRENQPNVFIFTESSATNTK